MTIHGHASHTNVRPEFRSWTSMMSRCFNKKYYQYYRHGGRGITVCERWKTYWNFYLDMGDRPKGMTLDRINNDGNYEPGNCRWATPKMQARNRSSSVYLEIDGERLSVADWAERKNLTQGALRRRVLLSKPDLFRPVCGKGENHGHAKLRENDIHRIRESHLFGAKVIDLAKTYGISTRNINSIVSRETWKNVNP